MKILFIISHYFKRLDGSLKNCIKHKNIISQYIVY